MKKLLLIIAILALSSATDISANIQSDSLTLHNNERNAYGVPSLTWSTTLAASAQTYAETMASTGTTSHSTGRVNVGENLAWGSGSSITLTSLGNLWIAEKQYYIPGQDFPDVSTTGSWSDVAHYTQLMWELTTEVGCGIAQASSGRYNYVCHYSPQGNIDGEPVYTVTSTSTSTTASTSTSTSNSTSISSPTTTKNTTTSTSTPTTTKNSTVSTNTSTSTPTTTKNTSTSTSTPSTTKNATAGSSTATSNTTTSTNTNTSASASTTTTNTSSTQTQFITDSLTAHNTERNNYGVPSLVWNTSLAASAQAYAETMASTGTTSHSTGRVNVGENLAWGSGSSITVTHLVGLWIDEKQYFIAGEDFPDCSTTGDWEDVAHYTALMWEKTTDLGCGMAQASSGRYNYVCHYYVQGNIDGEPVY